MWAQTCFHQLSFLFNRSMSSRPSGQKDNVNTSDGMLESLYIGVKSNNSPTKQHLRIQIPTPNRIRFKLKDMKRSFQKQLKLYRQKHETNIEHTYQESNLTLCLDDKVQPHPLWTTSCQDHATEPPKLFHIGKLIDSGSFGSVFVLNNNQDVSQCIKIGNSRVNVDDEMAACHRHARVSKCESIISLYGYGQIIGKHFTSYVVMEYAQGGDLFSAIEEDLYTQSAESINFACVNLVDALCALQDAKIVHCDIKPENIVLMDRTVLGSVRLIDFGGAVNEHSKSGSYTLQYCSPEQSTKKNINCKSDVFSMGLVFAVLLNFSSPWSKTANHDFFNFMDEDRPYSMAIDSRNRWIQSLKNQPTLFHMLQINPGLRSSAHHIKHMIQKSPVASSI